MGRTGLCHIVKAKTVIQGWVIPEASLRYSRLNFTIRGAKMTSVLSRRTEERHRELLEHCNVVFSDVAAKLPLGCKSLAKALFNSVVKSKPFQPCQP